MNSKYDLVPVLWNAPFKGHHLKPVNARHILAKRLRWDELRALPARQQKSNIYICKRCGAEVCWTEGKSGKRYLANVTKESYSYGPRGRRTGHDWYFDPTDWHSKTCTPTADGSVHPTAVRYEDRNARLRAEHEADVAARTEQAPYTPTPDEVQDLHDELVAGALEDQQ